MILLNVLSEFDMIEYEKKLSRFYKDIEIIEEIIEKDVEDLIIILKKNTY